MTDSQLLDWLESHTAYLDFGKGGSDYYENGYKPGDSGEDCLTLREFVTRQIEKGNQR